MRRKDLPQHPQFQEFITFMRIKNVADGTIEQYSRILGAVFDFVALGQAPPATITTEQLYDYFLSLRKSGLAQKTIADRIVVAKRFFGFLMQEECITDDPTRRIPYPRLSQHLPKALSLAEFKRLLAAFDSTTLLGRRDQIFFQLAYAGGLRINEVTHLRVEDIDWTEGSLRVIGKGDKERCVYLKEDMMHMLQAYVEDARPKKWLFAGRGGKSVTARNMQGRFELYVEKAGLPKWVTPHSLRHSIAVHYLLGGAPISFVQGLLGHAKLTTTGIYTRLTDPMMKEITVRIPTALDADEGQERRLQERAVAYEADLEYWSDFVRLVLNG